MFNILTSYLLRIINRYTYIYLEGSCKIKSSIGVLDLLSNLEY